MNKINVQQLKQAVIDGALCAYETNGENHNNWSYFTGFYAAVNELARQGFLTNGQAKYIDGLFFSLYYEASDKIKESAHSQAAANAFQ